MTEFTLHHGDCLNVMATMADNSIDAIVTDPPYGLSFMGKHWDHGVPGVEFWLQALRLLKPGGHLLSFGGSRTYHRMAVAIEDAGFEIRDQIMWIYGSGFPKSLDVSKAIDAAAGAEREVVGIIHNPATTLGNGQTMSGGVAQQSPTITAPATPDAERWNGYGTALKPAHEPICMARKPLTGTVAANVLAWGTGAINVDGCRVTLNGEVIERPARFTGRLTNAHMEMRPWMQERYAQGKPTKEDFVNNTGRWPANVIHDGSDEVTAGFPVNALSGGSAVRSQNRNMAFGMGEMERQVYNDTGSAARFFYCAKASKGERDAGLDGMETVIRNDGRAEHLKSGDVPMNRSNNPKSNHHPTVKPLSLMSYLVRLITPPGGVVLDPFMGSGSTGCGAVLEGFRFVGIEQEAEYLEIAQRRIEYWAASVRLPLLAMAAD